MYQHIYGIMAVVLQRQVMIIGYWDGKGFDKLVNGSAKTQTTSVNKMISSSGNYNDYVFTYRNMVMFFYQTNQNPPFGDEHPWRFCCWFLQNFSKLSWKFLWWSWYSDADNSLPKLCLSIDPTIIKWWHIIGMGNVYMGWL